MDQKRCISGDASRGTDDNQSPFLFEDIEVMRSYTLFEITYFDFKLRRYNERKLADTRCTAGSMVPASMILITVQSTTQSSIQRYRIMQLHAPAPILNLFRNEVLI